MGHDDDDEHDSIAAPSQSSDEDSKPRVADHVNAFPFMYICG